MKPFRLLVLSSLAVAFATPSFAAIARVGTGAGCTHTTLAGAVATVEAAGTGPHTIRVSTGSYSPPTPVTIREPVTIIGGYSSCTDPTNDDYAPIFYSPHSTFLTIDTNSAPERFAVRLEKINLNGLGSGSRGVFILGDVDVTLHQVEIAQMTEVAIDLRGNDDGRATLHLTSDEEAYLYANGGANYFGGAISCEEADLEIDGYGFYDNAAIESGGAIFLSACDLVLGNVFFTGNQALYGATLSAAFSSIRSAPGAFPRWGVNTATSVGDALYLDASTATLRNAILRGDPVDGGGAVYLSSGSQLTMNGSTSSCPEPVNGFCSAIVGATSDSEGAVLWLQSGSAATLHRTRLEGGYSPTRGAILVEDSQLMLESSVIVSTAGYSAVWVEGDQDTSLELLYVTMTDSDTTVVPVVIDATGETGPRLKILSSILWQENLPTVLGGDLGSPDIDCVLTSDTIPGTHVVSTGDPGFVDPPWDLHLTPDSPAVDFCDDSRLGAQYPDLDGELRGRDISVVPNAFAGAVFDVGVDEYLGFTNNSIFADGFEGGDATAWSAATP